MPRCSAGGSGRATRGAAGLALALALVAGCAGPPPELFPVAPLVSRSLPDGGTEREYDTDADGTGDFRERLDAGGRVASMIYGDPQRGGWDDEVRLSDVGRDPARELILLLDSVPYAMVREAWDGGRLRYFPPPSRVISVFPVMTDPAFCEFFGDTPCPGVESEYYDGRRLTSAFDAYVSGANTPWQRHLDYRLNPVAHAPAYLDGLPWYLHELRRTQQLWFASSAPRLAAYFVGTSALGARRGRDGHQAALVTLDRFCQHVMHRTRGRTRITLLSDHGHNLVMSRLLRLDRAFTDLGYRVRDRIEAPQDIVLPRFGIVTYASIHTRCPERVAADVSGLEGVDFAVYLDRPRDEVVVVGPRGRARIARHDAARADAGSHGGTRRTADAVGRGGRGGAGVAYRYACDVGDPLLLRPVLDRLPRGSTADAPPGFIADAVLFAATQDHAYPDVVHRLWRAFHGLIAHTPDVMVAIGDGYHAGSGLFSTLLPLAAAHGNLRPPSSYAFATTTAGALPETLRIEDLRAALESLGVDVGGEGRR